MGKRRAPSTAFKKGHKKVGGRKKGTPNRFSRDMKEALLAALEGFGGAEKYFKRHLNRTPRSMLQLIGKLLPTQLTGKDGGPIDVLVEQAQGQLSNLSDAELVVLTKLLGKAGLINSIPSKEEKQ